MKTNHFISCLLLVSLFSISCKKESFPELPGQWVSDAIYGELDNGSYGWKPAGGYNHFYSFGTNGRFGTFTDVPGGGGTYRYNSQTGELLLNYEADRYGHTARIETVMVERLNNGSIIISYSVGIPYKIKYSRYD